VTAAIDRFNDAFDAALDHGGAPIQFSERRPRQFREGLPHVLDFTLERGGDLLDARRVAALAPGKLSAGLTREPFLVEWSFQVPIMNGEVGVTAVASQFGAVRRSNGPARRGDEPSSHFTFGCAGPVPGTEREL
jgi:hypothetical protein